MKKKYKHLSGKERELISVLHAKQISISEIARTLKRSKSTISRELSRPTSRFFRGVYLGESSQKLYITRWKNTHKRERLKTQKIKEYVLTRLKRYWSPEIIAGRLNRFGIKISYEAIYQYIYDGNRHLVQYLPKKHLARKRIWQYRKRKKSNIPNRIDIDLRPQNANDRLEFGHFEADTILSSKKSKSALLVLVDRKTRYTKIKKLDRKTASLTSSLIVSALSECNITHIHSITYDNGCEFVKHELVNEKLGTKSYFCKPYHAWEKGTVENTNGVIRRFFSKRTDFDKISDRKIKFVEDWINSKPMKILGFRTPAEAYLEAIVPLAC